VALEAQGRLAGGLADVFGVFWIGPCLPPLSFKTNLGDRGVGDRLEGRSEAAVKESILPIRSIEMPLPPPLSAIACRGEPR